MGRAPVRIDQTSVRFRNQLVGLRAKMFPCRLLAAGRITSTSIIYQAVEKTCIAWSNRVHDAYSLLGYAADKGRDKNRDREMRLR